MQGKPQQQIFSSILFIIPANFNVMNKQGLRLTVGNFGSCNINSKCSTKNKHRHQLKMQGDIHHGTLISEFKLESKSPPLPVGGGRKKLNLELQWYVCNN